MLVPTGLRLDEALSANRLTYEQLAPDYLRTGHLRCVQARRWLAPLIHAAAPAEKTSLLELGPADGYLTGFLGTLGFDVTAIDFAASMCSATRQNAPEAKVIHAEFLSHEFTDRYDVVLVSAFAHLFPAPWDVTVLAKANALLSPGGMVYAATTLHQHSTSGYLAKPDSTETRLRWRARHTRASFEQVIANAELQVASFYQTADHYMPQKSWGNWILTGGRS